MKKTHILSTLAAAILVSGVAGTAQAQQRGAASILQPTQSKLGGGGINLGIANRPGNQVGGGFAVKPGGGRLIGQDGGSLMSKNGAGIISRDSAGFRR